jgi:hypothetical protein
MLFGTRSISERPWADMKFAASLSIDLWLNFRILCVTVCPWSLSLLQTRDECSNQLMFPVLPTKTLNDKTNSYSKESCTCNRLWRSIGLWGVEVPTFSTQSSHRQRWGCQPYAPAALYPQERFLVLISVKGWVDPRVIVRLNDYVNWNFQWLHPESKPRPSGLQLNAATKYVSACPPP